MTRDERPLFNGGGMAELKMLRGKIVHGLSRLLDPTLRVFEALVIVLSASLVGIVFLQVCLRYLTNSSFYGSEELARYIFAWVVFLSAACALERGLHFTVGFFVDLLPMSASRAIKQSVLVVVLAILGVITVNGVHLTIQNWGQLSSSMRVPLSLPYAAIPLSTAVMFLVTLRKLASSFDKRHSTGAA